MFSAMPVVTVAASCSPPLPGDSWNELLQHESSASLLEKPPRELFGVTLAGTSASALLSAWLIEEPDGPALVFWLLALWKAEEKSMVLKVSLMYSRGQRQFCLIQPPRWHTRSSLEDIEIVAMVVTPRKVCDPLPCGCWRIFVVFRTGSWFWS